jgi:helix-turn-helix protein
VVSGCHVMTTNTQSSLHDRGAFKIIEAAIYLGVSVSQVRRYIQRRLITRLPGIRHIVIAKAECDRFLREQTDIGKLAA